MSASFRRISLSQFERISLHCSGGVDRPSNENESLEELSNMDTTALPAPRGGAGAVLSMV